jgi:DNA processing protein
LVLALPGSIYSQTSRGTNRLIKAGAFPILNPADILEVLNLDLQAAETIDMVKAASDAEEEILSLLKQETEVDQLVRETKLPISEINTILSLLEIKGRIKNLGSNRYVKIR